MNTRWIIYVVAALAVGLLIGRAAPQADLRAARAEIEQLKKRGASQATSRTAMAGVEQMLQVRRDEVARARRPRGDHPPAAAVHADAAPAGTNAAPVEARTNRPHRGPPWRGGSNEIAQAKQAWQLRGEIARTQFLEKAKLSTDQAAAFDVVIEAMNVRLGESIDRWAAAIRKDDVLTPETGLRMMNELSSALVLTYDELDRKLPEGWRAEAGPRFELVRFVDPEVLTPLQDLEGVIERSELDAEGAPVPPPPPPRP